MRIVFDTYAWIEFFQGTKKGEKVRRYLSEEVFTPAIVLLELSYKSDKEGWDFQKLFGFIKHNSKIVGINEEFILGFGEVYNKAKKQVRKIGIADVIVLQTALLHEAKILTGDKHFEKMKNVIVI